MFSKKLSQLIRKLLFCPFLVYFIAKEHPSNSAFLNFSYSQFLKNMELVPVKRNCRHFLSHWPLAAAASSSNLIGNWNSSFAFQRIGRKIQKYRRHPRFSRPLDCSSWSPMAKRFSEPGEQPRLVGFWAPGSIWAVFYLRLLDLCTASSARCWPTVLSIFLVCFLNKCSFA